MRLIDADFLREQIAWLEKCNVNKLEMIKIIDEVPTVESDYEWGYSEGVHDTERPQGEWIEDSGNIACSQCHTIWLYRRTDFCPNCGAYMKGSDNG